MVGQIRDGGPLTPQPPEPPQDDAFDKIAKRVRDRYIAPPQTQRETFTQEYLDNREFYESLAVVSNGWYVDRGARRLVRAGETSTLYALWVLWRARRLKFPFTACVLMTDERHYPPMNARWAPRAYLVRLYTGNVLYVTAEKRRGDSFLGAPPYTIVRSWFWRLVDRWV